MRSTPGIRFPLAAEASGNMLGTRSGRATSGAALRSSFALLGGKTSGGNGGREAAQAAAGGVSGDGGGEGTCFQKNTERSVLYVRLIVNCSYATLTRAKLNKIREEVLELSL